VGFFARFFAGFFRWVYPKKNPAGFLNPANFTFIGPGMSVYGPKPSEFVILLLHLPVSCSKKIDGLYPASIALLWR